MNVDGSNIFVAPTYPLYFGVGNDKFDKRVIYLIKHFLKHRLKEVVGDLVEDAVKNNDAIKDAVSESVEVSVNEALGNSEAISTLVDGKIQDAISNKSVIKTIDIDNPENEFDVGTFVIWPGESNEKFSHGFVYEKTADGWAEVNTMNVIK